MLSNHNTAPRCATMGCGTISLEMQVAKKKLLFLRHLFPLEESSLANEILVVQVNNHLPGLVQECKNLIKSLNLPNLFDKEVRSAYSKLIWKNKVNTAIKEYEESKLKSSFSSKSKLKEGPMMGESFDQKEYISDLTLTKARMKFQIRSKMVDAKFNYSAKYEKELWKCVTKLN